jgi:hypothetical protein
MKTTLRVIGTVLAFILAVIGIQACGMLTIAGLDGILRPAWEGDITMGKAILLLSTMFTIVLATTVVCGLRAIQRENNRLYRESLRRREPAPGTFHSEEIEVEVEVVKSGDPYTGIFPSPRPPIRN